MARQLQLWPGGDEVIKTILWDFDGVIAESVNVKTEAFHEMYLPFGEEIARKVVEHHMANGGVSRFEKFRIYHDSFLNIKLSSQDIDCMAQSFSELVLNKVVASPYIPGVMDFIKNNQTKYQHYIISGTPHKEMKVIVARRNLSSYFNDVMGSPRTKSEWIKDLVSNGEIEVGSSVFIGDATTDYNAANETGMKFILREVDYNKGIFLNYTGIRVDNFIGFNKIIEAL
jgi:phosphoglycolate phosphatase-like HAD superfamily hydrolase